MSLYRADLMRSMSEDLQIPREVSAIDAPSLRSGPRHSLLSEALIYKDSIASPLHTLSLPLRAQLSHSQRHIKIYS